MLSFVFCLIWIVIRAPTASPTVANTLYDYTVASYLGVQGQEESYNFPFSYASDANTFKISVAMGTFVNTNGDLYAASYSSNTAKSTIVPRVSGSDYNVYAFAGGGTNAASTEASTVKLSGPVDVWGDSNDLIYILELTSKQVRTIDVVGTVSIYAGTGNTVSSSAGDSGPATSADFVNPSAICGDSSGNLFIVDSHSLSANIRKISRLNTIQTFAGSCCDGSSGTSSGDFGQVTNAGLVIPSDVFVDSAGYVFIVDHDYHVIRKVDGTTNIITRISGPGSSSRDSNLRNYNRAVGTSTPLYHPYSVWGDSVGNLFWTEQSNVVIRTMIPYTSKVYVIGGAFMYTSTSYTGGGDSTSAAFSAVGFISGDTVGNLFVSVPSDYVVAKLKNVGSFTLYNDFVVTSASLITIDGSTRDSLDYFTVVGASMDGTSVAGLTDVTSINLMSSATNTVTSRTYIFSFFDGTFTKMISATLNLVNQLPYVKVNSAAYCSGNVAPNTCWSSGGNIPLVFNSGDGGYGLLNLVLKVTSPAPTYAPSIAPTYSFKPTFYPTVAPSFTYSTFVQTTPTQVFIADTYRDSLDYISFQGATMGGGNLRSIPAKICVLNGATYSSTSRTYIFGNYELSEFSSATSYTKMVSVQLTLVGNIPFIVALGARYLAGNYSASCTTMNTAFSTGGIGGIATTSGMSGYGVAQVVFVITSATTPTAIPTISFTPTVYPTSQPSNHPSRQPSSQPSRRPSAQPSSKPSVQPTSQPSRQPICRPTCQPTSQPNSKPSSRPSGQPSTQPSRQPSCQPTSQPFNKPSTQPTSRPSTQPSRQPVSRPSSFPTGQPSMQPSQQPSKQPASVPTSCPSNRPSCQPTRQPTNQPSSRPTIQPTEQPTARPTVQPSVQPTSKPNRIPTSQPSVRPSCQPSSQPSCHPSRQPTSQPLSHPTSVPSNLPSVQPSCQPFSKPTSQPSSQPSLQPFRHPSTQPTCQPNGRPSSKPSSQPSFHPSSYPTVQPSRQPSSQPNSLPSNQPTSQPNNYPTSQPSCQPSENPSSRPSGQPSQQPSRQPIDQPSSIPSSFPTSQPSFQPSMSPTTQPTQQPVDVPSSQPTSLPSQQPTCQPSTLPTGHPTSQPFNVPSRQPAARPSGNPSGIPTKLPNRSPTSQPSGAPSCTPSIVPTSHPTGQPSHQPSSQPSEQPYSTPSFSPSKFPSSLPTSQPSRQPTSQPSTSPTVCPTKQPISVPSSQPSVYPSNIPTAQPSRLPTQQPSRQPFSYPTSQPSKQPLARPTSQPSGQPFRQPTNQPTMRPSSQPSTQPSSHPSVSASSPYVASLPVNTSLTVKGGRDSFKIILPFFQNYPINNLALSDINLVSNASDLSSVVFGDRHLTRNLKRGIFVNDVTIDSYGRSASVIPDFNGDGFDDLLIGDPYASKAYVLFGSAEGFVDAEKGFTIFGEDDNDMVGWSVSSAGDVNNDTYADIIIGAPYENGVGAVYVIYGHPLHACNVKLENLNSTIGFKIRGERLGDGFGLSVSDAGDVNGDGIDDVVVGAAMLSARGTGAAYVLFGKLSKNLGTTTLLTSEMGFKFTGLSYGYVGYTVSGAGDVNGDSFDDVIVGSAPTRTTITQSSYILFGSSKCVNSNAMYLNSSQGIAIAGYSHYVMGVGDINGDNIDDLVIGDQLGLLVTGGRIISRSVNVGSFPTLMPTAVPTVATTKPTTLKPSLAPTTLKPTVSPTAPTIAPTIGPTGPTNVPSSMPSSPTEQPTVTPTAPTFTPTIEPSIAPSVTPTNTEPPSESPTVEPSCSPSEKPTIMPSSVNPTLSPTDKPTVYFRPTRLPTPVPTAAPTNLTTSYVIVATDNEVETYSRSHININFICNSSLDIVIIDSGGHDMFTVYPQSGTTLTIEKFNVTGDVINLENMRTVFKFEDLNITAGSVVINFEADQKIHILNLEPSDINSNHFRFQSPSKQTSDEITDYIRYAKLAAGIGAATFVGVIVFYFVYKGMYNVENEKIKDMEITELMTQLQSDHSYYDIEQGVVEDVNKQDPTKTKQKIKLKSCKRLFLCHYDMDQFGNYLVELQLQRQQEQEEKEKEEHSIHDVVSCYIEKFESGSQQSTTSSNDGVLERVESELDLTEIIIQTEKANQALDINQKEVAFSKAEIILVNDDIYDRISLSSVRSKDLDIILSQNNIVKKLDDSTSEENISIYDSDNEDFLLFEVPSGGSSIVFAKELSKHEHNDSSSLSSFAVSSDSMLSV